MKRVKKLTGTKQQNKQGRARTQKGKTAAVSDRQLTQILDAVFGFVGLFTLDGVFIFGNQMAFEAAGVTREETIGKLFWETPWWNYDPTIQAELRGAMARAAKGETCRYETRIQVKGGALISVDCTFSPLRGADGSVTGIVGFGVDVTERRRAEMSLRSSEERFRQLAENIPEVFWIANIGTGAIEYISPTYESVWGRSCRDLYARPLEWIEAIHPDDRDRVEQAFSKGLLSGLFDHEYRVVRPDGQVRWINDRGFPVVDHQGKSYRMIGVATDITERKKLAEREVARHEQLKQLSELSMMLSGDPAVVLERVVRMIGELFEVPVVCLSELAGSELLFRAVYESGQVVSDAGSCPLNFTPCATVEQSHDIQIYDRVAERFPQASFLRTHNAYSYCGFPALNNQGQVVAITCLLDDKPHEFTDDDKSLLRIIGQRLATEMERGKILADRARVERELRENQRRLVEAQRIGRMGSWESDLVTGAIICSDEMYRIFEIDPQSLEWSFEGFLKNVHPEDRERVRQVRKDSIERKVPYEATYRLQMSDGRIRWVQTYGTTEYADDGTPLRIIGTVQDITERKRTEQQIAESLREKEMLLREIHHRVKNNLQIISSLLHFHSNKVGGAEAKAVFLDGQDRLRSMILVHDKLYRSENFSSIDFADYVRSLAGELERSNHTHSRNIDLTINVEKISLPVEIAPPCGMILSELLTNIFKYAFPDGRPGKVLIRAATAGDRLVMTVQDNGIGFHENGGGSPGRFGLQMVRGLAEQLEGTVQIESKNGTIVTLDIPIRSHVHGN